MLSQLIFFVVDSHVKIYQLQAIKKELMMGKNQVFGGKCSELLANWNQESLSWRTYLPLFQMEDWTWSDPLPQSGMIANGQLYQLNNLEHPILENDGFVLPTPVASDGAQGAILNEKTKIVWTKNGTLRKLTNNGVVITHPDRKTSYTNMSHGKTRTAHALCLEKSRKNRIWLRPWSHSLQTGGDTPSASNWREISGQSPVCRMDDGISNRLDSNRIRKQRLIALGNAIVPACSQYIGECILRSGLI